MAFNPQQLEAIGHGCQEGALLVSAAAGSGKTTVMAQRVKRLLADPELGIQADRLFVSTFTRAAAAELRGRIASLLNQELEEARTQGDTRRAAWLQKQRIYLQRAAIGTTDSYCIRLVQQHFSLLDIAPDFEIADALQLERIQQQAVSAVVDRALTQDPDFVRLASLYGRSREDGSVSRLCLDLHRYLQGLEDPMEALDRFAQNWEPGVHISATPWGKALASHALLPLEDALRGMEALTDDLPTEPALEPMAAVLKRDYALLAQMKEEADLCAGEGNRQAWESLSVPPKKDRWPTLKKEYKEGYGPQAAALKKERDRLWDQVKGALEPFQSFGLVEEEAIPLVRAFLRAGRELEEEIWNLKKQEKRFGFSDCEHLALQLLWKDGQRTPLAEEISAGFATVMVDEYQDTSALQERIYRCLARADGSNLFFVGDIKQGIYRFRQADPGIFQEKLDTYPLTGEGNGPRLLPLSANYRSDKVILDGCNAVFDLIMTRRLGGVEYDTPQQRLTPGNPDLNQGVFQAVLLEADPDQEEAQKRDKTRCEALWTAGKIRRLLEEKTLVRDKTGELRPVTPQDICLIFRSRSAFPVFLGVLEEAGIPAYADTAENLLECQAVEPLAHLLRVLDNPTQDLSLTAALLSPLLGFQVDDLLYLRRIKRKGSLYAALQQGAVSKTLPEGLREKYARVVEQLNGWSRMAFCLPVSQLLEEIMARTCYPAAVAARADGQRALGELNTFMAWAGGKGESGLHSVIRAMEIAQLTGRGPEQAPGAQVRPGCVTLMTSHGSKGLEFPVVILCDLGHAFNRMDERQPALLHSKLGVGIKYTTPEGGLVNTGARKAIATALGDEALSEEMRILYVSLTRARDRLYLPLPFTTLAEEKNTLGEQGMEYALSKCQSWQQWLALALAELDGQLDSPVEIVREKLPLPGERGEKPASFAQRAGELAAEQPEEKALELRHLWEEADQAQARLAVLEKVPIKTSVSALSHKPYTQSLARPAFARRDGHLTGAERGTMTHKALQRMELRLPFRPLEQLDRLVEQGILTPQEREGLDLAALETLGSSPALEHIASAKEQMKEYPFITQVAAQTVMEDKGEDYGQARCLVQGVVDLVLIFEDHAEIWDWKTDRGKTAQELADTYRSQLWLYRYAMEKRLKVPVTRCVLYSLALGQEVEIPLI